MNAITYLGGFYKIKPLFIPQDALVSGFLNKIIMFLASGHAAQFLFVYRTYAMS